MTARSPGETACDPVARPLCGAPVVFLPGLVAGRFPGSGRGEALALPAGLGRGEPMTPERALCLTPASTDRGPTSCVRLPRRRPASLYVLRSSSARIGRSIFVLRRNAAAWRGVAWPISTRLAPAASNGSRARGNCTAWSRQCTHP